MENATFSTDNSYVTLFFNNSIVLQDGFDIYKAIEVSVTGPMEPYNFSWYLNNSDYYFAGIGTEYFKIDLDFLDTQLYGTETENITVCFQNTTQIKHHTCNRFLDNVPCYTFALYGVESSIDKCGDLDYPRIGWLAFLVQMGFASVFTLLGFSMGGAWDTLFLLQFVHLIPVMQFYMPSCYKYFFDYFRWTNMEDDWLAIWLRHAICTDTWPSEMDAPTYNFEKTGFENRMFMYNMADMFTFVVLAFMTVPLFSIVRLLMPGM